MVSLVGKRLRLCSVVPPPNPHFSGVISLPHPTPPHPHARHDALLISLGFMQMPAFSQCEEEVRERIFMSLLRIEKGGILWGLRMSSRMKVGHHGASPGQLPSPTWEAPLSEPTLLTLYFRCDGYTFTLPLLLALSCLFL